MTQQRTPQFCFVPHAEIIWGCYEDRPLMTRYKLARIRGWNLYIHHFHRSDEDRELHDHPWGFWSLILWGGYVEVTPAQREFTTSLNEPRVKRAWIGPGKLIYRPAEWIHRVEIPVGKCSWSLVVTTSKRRCWGFWTRQGWVPWKLFTSNRDCG